MVQAAFTQSVPALRAISYRISSTPTKLLPQIAPQIAASLWSCKDVISASPESLKAGSDASSLVHRLKTSLSSLLQDRTIEGRWAAVVLVKAAIEAGGVEILSKSNGWVRSLLAILKKPDPPTTRNLVVITLTRIFMLTWDYSNLVREITTPALPAFISSCISNVDNKCCSASELQTVLESFATLIPRHPTVFRTHETQIRSTFMKVLSSASSDVDSEKHYTEHHKYASQRLRVLLHHCAPKQGGSEKRDESLKATVSVAHATCDRLFRSLVESWRPLAGQQQATRGPQLSAGNPEVASEKTIGLADWNGILAGERLVTLLQMLNSHLETTTAGTVILRIGLVVDLMTRLLSLTVPFGTNVVKFNNEIPKDEREEMFSILPSIHLATLGLLNTTMARLGSSSFTFAQGVMELVVAVYVAERKDVQTRTATYSTLKAMLELIGPSMAKEEISELTPVIKGCCEDLLPTDEKPTSTASVQANGTQQKQHLPNSDLSLQGSKTQSSHPTILNDLKYAAEALLPVLLTKVNPADMPRKLRTQIERTAVLTKNKDALVACVLNPGRKETGTGVQTSLLPLLAREYPSSYEVEALLRPRMPPVITKARRAKEGDDDRDDEDGEFSVDGSANSQIMDEENDGEEDVEPTAGLLDALDQNGRTGYSREDIQDLHVTSPPPADLHLPVPSQTPVSALQENVASSTKRAAPESTHEESSAKRTRTSPSAEALGVDSAASLPGASARISPPVTVAVEQSFAPQATTEQVAELPGHSADQAGVVAARNPGDAGSDSDFEMPPLTMEPDTDPEDEAQDGGEDEG